MLESVLRVSTNNCCMFTVAIVDEQLVLVSVLVVCARSRAGVRTRSRRQLPHGNKLSEAASECKLDSARTPSFLLPSLEPELLRYIRRL